MYADQVSYYAVQYLIFLKKRSSTVQCLLLPADYWYFSLCLYVYNKCISVQPSISNILIQAQQCCQILQIFNKFKQ